MVKVLQLCFLSAISLVQALNSTVDQKDETKVDINTVFDNDSTNFCRMDKTEAIGATCDVTFHEINEVNKNIRPQLLSLVQSDFFKYFKLDLYKECPFWSDNNGYCVNRACAVDVVEDWDSLPEYWQPEILGNIENATTDITDDECSFLDELCDKPRFETEKDIEYCDTNDFNSQHSVLVDLTANPERFTGYGGEQSSQIWSSIYKENCFSLGDENQCLAKDAFYRLISGLHASIGTHLSNEHLNTETGKWEPNLELFMTRVGNFPDRVSNIYFNFAVVAKALWKIRPYMNELGFCNAYNEDVKGMIDGVVSQLDSKVFNEDLLFHDEVSGQLKDDFRIRFKNVTKIMDCVQCDRCRLWGKVQTTGYATSLKILFEMDNDDDVARQHVVDKLTKYELIALFNTFDRLSKSVEAVNRFEEMYNYQLKSPGEKLASFFQLDNFFKVLNDKFNSANHSFQEKTSVSNVEKKVNEFNDLKMPEKKKETHTEVREQASGVFKEAWDAEWSNFKQALRFIVTSYTDLPSTVSKYIVLKLNKLWNKFIGVPNYLEEGEELEYPSYNYEE
ncbi:Ero1 [Kluyveromyces lactis]|nr:Ero1 [Kluyveromyces lactis]